MECTSGPSNTICFIFLCMLLFFCQLIFAFKTSLNFYLQWVIHNADSWVIPISTIFSKWSNTWNDSSFLFIFPTVCFSMDIWCTHEFTVVSRPAAQLLSWDFFYYNSPLLAPLILVFQNLLSFIFLCWGSMSSRRASQVALTV